MKVHKPTEKRPTGSTQHRVTWVGTSLSKVLDRNKFEHDSNVKLTTVKAYCVKEEGNFPKSNFQETVPRVLSKGDIDTLVLETGSIEITNMDVNNAVMDPNKDIKDYKEEWFAKAEESSTELFKIAENAIADNEHINVIILKRLPRFDRSSDDILNIKSKISTFANQTYDQLWLKRGSPQRIHVIDIKLLENEGYLKNLIYGTHENTKYDGIHMLGRGASRHYTYRAIQAISPIISKPNPDKKLPCFSRKWSNSGVSRANKDYHQNCPQARYMRQSASQQPRVRSDRLFSEVLKGSSQQETNHTYSVPTKNFFNPLNC